MIDDHVKAIKLVVQLKKDLQVVGVKMCNYIYIDGRRFALIILGKRNINDEDIQLQS